MKKKWKKGTNQNKNKQKCHEDQATACLSEAKT